MNPLETESLSFSGQILIEASAGTGKTYTISNLFLRLIVGHKTKALTVDQILLVTFTNAATAELRERILARITSALVDFRRGTSNDPFVAMLISEVSDLVLATQRLLVAKQNMDLAAIFTIHGFAQRVLTEEAFESGVQFERRFVLDESEYLMQATQDYWRKHVIHASSIEIELFLKQWQSPTQLLHASYGLLYREIILPSIDEINSLLKIKLDEYQTQITALKQWWLTNDVSDFLQSAGLKKNAVVAKLDTLQKFHAFCEHEQWEFYRGKDSWDVFSEEKINKAKTSKSKDVSHLGFSRFDELSALQSQVHDLIRQYHIVNFVSFTRHHKCNAKMRDAVVSPDDLLHDLHAALSRGESSSALVDKLQQRYPVAMVDEFQDTDNVQYSIFAKVYQNTSLHCLLMIGDPKQAIYGFRGGDIFTYIKAKRATSETHRFTLTTNWRTQSSLVEAVNQLFQVSEQGFIYKQDIPFQPVIAAKPTKTIVTSETSLSAMEVRFLTHEDNGVWSNQSAMQTLAIECANKVKKLLVSGVCDEAKIVSQDITILVRDRVEASLIKEALFTKGIDSVFLSKENVMSTDTAYSLWLLLRALDNPQTESLIVALLLDPLLGYTEQSLQILKNDTGAWASTLHVFTKGKNLWLKSGVSSAIQYVVQEFDIIHKIASHHQQAFRILTDWRHLVEVLQHKSQVFTGTDELVHWFGEMIQNPELEQEQQLRLETDGELVQITTIHGSKGLQYPIVMLPFASRYKKNNDIVYHDQDNKLRCDLLGSDSNASRQIEKERLAEDIRLLYVALTRAEWFCWLGVWNCQHRNKRKSSGFTETALGHLLLGHVDEIDALKLTDSAIVSRLKAVFLGSDTEVILQEEEPCNDSSVNDVDKFLADVQPITKQFPTDWRLHSYSSISKNRIASLELEGHEVDKKAYNEKGVEQIINTEVGVSENIRFSFTKGANAGSFLHDVLEHSDFQCNETVLASCQNMSIRYGVDEALLEEIAQWLLETLDTPLPLVDGGKLAPLNHLHASAKLAEMEFYLPLKHIAIADFNRLIADALGKTIYHYNLTELNGVMKGYIDLVFYQNGKYYVADYKSNHLGDESTDYSQERLDEVMEHHDYYLQALLYSVALHRFLSQRIKHYRYDLHHGGAFYLFLRGMSPYDIGAGVLHTRFPEDVIVNFDNLFAGKCDAR